MLGRRTDVSSIALRRDFLFSFGVVALSEGTFSVVPGDVISLLALRVAFNERFALEPLWELALEEACIRAEGFSVGEPVPPAAGDATSPGLAVAPAVPVTSVPAATAVRGPGLTP